MTVSRSSGPMRSSPNDRSSMPMGITRACTAAANLSAQVTLPAKSSRYTNSALMENFNFSMNRRLVST